MSFVKIAQLEDTVSRSATAADRPEHRSRRVRTMLALAAISILGVLSLTACGAGQIAQSANQRSGVDGAAGNVGSIEIHDAVIVAPKDNFWEAGSELQLSLTIVNSGTEADELTSVTYGDAEALLVPSGAPTDGTPAAETSAAPTAAPPASESSSSESPPSGSGTSDPAASGSSASETSAAVPTYVPPTSVPFALQPNTDFGVPRDGTITIEKSTADLYPSQLVKIVFTFKNAGELTIEIPIGVPLTEEPQATPYNFHDGEAAEG